MNAAPLTITPPNQVDVTQPFRVIFHGYDGDPKKPAGMTFQVNTLDLRQPTEFLKIGDVIPRTKIKLVSFTSKTQLNPKTGQMDDVSELTVAHSDTGKTTMLVLTRVTDVPDGAR